MQVSASRIVSPVLLLMILLGSGCQPGRGSLNGKVTYQGKPVVFGAVTLDAGDGVPRVASLNPDGSYQFEDVPAVNVTLAVASPDPTKLPPPLDENGKPVPMSKLDRGKWFPLPDTFTDPRKSGISTDIKVGPNTFDIELK